MQQRRFRPGDVLDDYCPRERRITDHAIVAMIDDHIKQTRCVVCDAEHEYKDGKLPPQRRKKPQTALFTQVLDGLQGPQPAARVSTQADADAAVDADELLDPSDPSDPPPPPPVVATLVSGNGHEADAVATVVAEIAAVTPPDGEPEGEAATSREEGLWRRTLIRAALPRPEGQPPPQTRPAPDFTVRQPGSHRGQRPGHRRGGQQGQGSGSSGPMRFGRGGQGHGQGHNAGRSRRRRGGKKNQ